MTLTTTPSFLSREGILETGTDFGSPDRTRARPTRPFDSRPPVTPAASDRSATAEGAQDHMSSAQPSRSLPQEIPHVARTRAGRLALIMMGTGGVISGMALIALRKRRPTSLGDRMPHLVSVASGLTGRLKAAATH